VFDLQTDNALISKLL